MEGRTYGIFILGYDLIQDTLNEFEMPCDRAFEICKKAYDSFLKSEYNDHSKSEYDCLQEWLSSQTLEEFMNKFF